MMKQVVLVLCLVCVVITLCSGFLLSNSILAEFDRPRITPIVNDIFFNGPPITEYDFIIVGAGPAGCVLANRLSENPKWKVLLIEAGTWENFLHGIPLLAAYFQSSGSNWGYTAEKQKGSCLGMINEQCAFPRGKGIGGTSLINYMIYNRGNKIDFDRWAEAGNPGWSYEEVLPYFLKSEASTLKNIPVYSKYHSRSGPLSVQDVPYRTKLVRCFMKACKEAGHNETDYNGESQLGASYLQATIKDGQRHSAGRAYIEPIVGKRKNLHIISRGYVTRILIDPNTKKAYGIEFAKNKKYYSVLSTKEVILSAGTFNSPKLLMVSGVGPKDHLRQLNIPLIQDLPVGKTMWDHISHFGPTFVVERGPKDSLHIQRDLTKHTFKQYLAGQGPLTIPGGVEALALLKTPNSHQPPTVPDIELIFVPGSMASDLGTGTKTGFQLKQEIYDALYKPLEDTNIDVYSVLVMLFHPRSKGYMTLKDNNPFHWPKFYPNFFQDSDDVETMLHGIRAAIRIAETPTMKKLGVRLHDIPLPGCQHLQFNSDDYWRCSIRTLSCTLHHQVGTCKMGPESDPFSVVNHELKVHGVRRLRVVDTSIIPEAPTAHTNAASFMIGEKAADMIIDRWT